MEGCINQNEILVLISSRQLTMWLRRACGCRHSWPSFLCTADAIMSHRCTWAIRCLCDPGTLYTYWAWSPIRRNQPPAAPMYQQLGNCVEICVALRGYVSLNHYWATAELVLVSDVQEQAAQQCIHTLLRPTPEHVHSVNLLSGTENQWQTCLPSLSWDFAGRHSKERMC